MSDLSQLTPGRVGSSLTGDAAYYSRLWQKSYYFEISNKDTPNDVVEAFTLTLPPESVEFTQRQRVSKTKTFGGIFVDDYGLDNVQIVMSGTTGNSDVRETFRGSLGTKWFDGKNEIYYLRNKIVQYKRNRPDWDRYEIRLYDLGLIDAGEYAGNQLRRLASAMSDSWIVVIDDFKITRSKDRPFWYSYRIEMTGLTTTGSFRARTIRPNVRTETVLEKIDEIEEKMTTLDRIYAGYREVVDTISQVRSTFDQVRAKARTFYNAVGGIMSESFNAFNTAVSLATFPLDLVTDGVLALRGVRNAIESVGSGNTIDVIQARASKLDAEVRGLLYVERTLSDAEKAGAELVTYGKANDAAEVRTLPDPDGNNRAVVVYGDRTVRATDETTLEGLAARWYNNPDMAVAIAAYNGITGNDEITRGDMVRLPLFEQQERNAANLIYATKELRNELGADIRLDAAGRMVVAEYGDAALIDGPANVSQALRLRLAETIGRRVRLAVYGIRDAIGNPSSATLNYIAASIEETVLQEPRVVEINEMVFRGDGDTLHVAFQYVLSTGDSGEFQGAF